MQRPKDITTFRIWLIWNVEKRTDGEQAQGSLDPLRKQEV